MSMRRGHLRRQASVDYPRYPPANSTTQQPPPELLNMLASDYDSEAQDYSFEFPAPLPPVNRTREELNLAVVQKLVPDVVAILSVASHATVYDWADTPSPGWQKSGVEGALFICKLTPGQFHEERFHAIVLNRGGLDNFEAELRQSDPEGVEIVQDLVIITRVQDHERKANGIFIFSGGPGTSTEHSRAANGELMRDLALAAQRSRAAAEHHSTQSQFYEDRIEQDAINVQPHSSQQTIFNQFPSAASSRGAEGKDDNVLLKMFQQAAQKPPPTTAPDTRQADALMYALQQPVPGPVVSPGPQVAPIPTRKVDLLALFQGNQSDTDTGTRSIPPHQHHYPQQFHTQPSGPMYPPPNNPPQNNDLLKLFQGAGLA